MSTFIASLRQLTYPTHMPTHTCVKVAGSHFLLSSMKQLKIVVLLDIFVKTMIYSGFLDE